MGIFARLFSHEETVMTVVEFDREAVRPHLNALIDALGQLADAMDDDAARMSNPGWRGRLKDLRNARGDLRLLTRRAEFSKDELFEVLTTVRPLYRGRPQGLRSSGLPQYRGRSRDRGCTPGGQLRVDLWVRFAR